jgi:hypothetical protein
VTRLGPGKVALFLRQQSEELTRIWRLARASERPDVFPGLLDDVIARFFEEAAQPLANGAAPEDLWRGLSGLVRWPPPLAPGELSEEWAILMEVLSAACESVNADPSVFSWLTRAVAACEAGTSALGGGRGKGPARIVTAVVFSPLEPRHRHEEGGVA